MLKGFRDFILRGNVIDLAVAVIIGAAFSAIVSSFVKDVMTPLMSAVIHLPNFSDLKADVNGVPVTYGNFLNAAISFLIVAFVVYFGLVVPVNSLLNRFKKPVPVAPPVTKACPECLSDIPIAAKRCAHCGQPVPLTPAA
jgi:large conductance mechanosensitive channel